MCLGFFVILHLFTLIPTELGASPALKCWPGAEAANETGLKEPQSPKCPSSGGSGSSSLLSGALQESQQQLIFRISGSTSIHILVFPKQATQHSQPQGQQSTANPGKAKQNIIISCCSCHTGNM